MFHHAFHRYFIYTWKITNSTTQFHELLCIKDSRWTITSKLRRSTEQFTLTAILTRFTTSIGSLIRTPVFPCKKENVKPVEKNWKMQKENSSQPYLHEHPSTLLSLTILTCFIYVLLYGATTSCEMKNI